MKEGQMLKRSCLVCGVLLVAAITLMPRSVLAQAGSIGGTIGKTDKSASGSVNEQPRGQTKQRTHLDTETAQQHRSRSSCPNVVGEWNSWASFVFGKSDTTFNADGTWRHKSGQGGKWWCEGTEALLQKPGEEPARYKFSRDGKQMISSSGSVLFSRD
jgi:hypothetical protein